jgi:hypothetical protein
MSITKNAMQKQISYRTAFMSQSKIKNWSDDRSRQIFIKFDKINEVIFIKYYPAGLTPLIKLKKDNHQILLKVIIIRISWLSVLQ